MSSRHAVAFLLAAAGGVAASHAQIVFSTNGPDFRLGAASGQDEVTTVETEAADDFVLGSDTRLTKAAIIGMVPHGTTAADLDRIMVKIYRVFPLDSNVIRTPQVPTRNNSPGDGSIQVRDSVGFPGRTELTFTMIALTPSLATANSVLDGIHPSPNQTTHGEGPASGDEIEIDMQMTIPIDLPAGHYFFVPQVWLRSGRFLWLSAPTPIVSPGTPFAGDLQAWIRNDFLFPDWLRIGRDIVGSGGGDPAPAFNMVFQLEGEPFCYANCDGSTSPPVLNVSDFICFQQRFAAGDPAANCDGSTSLPVLNVSDFICFQERFAAGCP
jgi:hypothetical protein